MTRIFLYFSFFLFPLSAFATHNSAGEITYEQIGEKTIRATIHTYTNANSPAFRDTLELFWGDGSSLRVERNSEVLLAADRKYSRYIAEHEYTDFGEYTLSMTDPFRIEGIKNIPFSGETNFYIETTFKLSTDFNSSPVLLEPPFAIGYVGQGFLHIPNAFDLEGDSLSFKLTTPMIGMGLPVLYYEYPSDVLGAGGNFGIMPETGAVVWDSPDLAGTYVVAIKIEEYRNGELIGTTIRDFMMDIGVSFTGNERPSVTVPENNYFASLGEAINFDVEFNDPENDVLIFATGGPFLLAESPAEFELFTEPQTPPLSVNFTWNTVAAHNREQPYTVVFTAIDEATEQMIMMRLVKIWVNENPLSIDPILEDMEWSVFPNPANESFSIKIENKEIEMLELEIRNAQGQIVFEKEMNKELQIVTDDFTEGVYFIVLKKKV